MGTVASTSPKGPARASEVPGTLLPIRTWVWIALLTAAFCWVFQNWLRVQAIWSWGEKEDWGHSFLMPVLGLYLLWQNRARILSTPATTFWPGLLPLLLGIVCYFYFIVGVPNHMLQGYAMVLTLSGVALFLAGPRLFRHLFIPIAMLVFGVKIAQQVMEKATFPLQLLASKGAWYVLRVISALSGDAFTVDVAGNTLEVTRAGKVYPLNVAEACSGMRMVIAFAALAATVGLFSCRHWWQRVALLLMAVPVALFMNTLRVAVLGLLTMVDKNLATGDAHMLIGTLLLVPGLFLFLGVVSLLNRFLLPAPDGPDGSSQGRTPGNAPPARSAAPVWACALALTVLTSAAVGIPVITRAFRMNVVKHAIYAEDGRLLGGIPTETDSWMRYPGTTDRREEKDVEAVLGTKNYVSRNYVLKSTYQTPKEVVVSLHAAYYTESIDTVPHVPDRCFVGGGMMIGEVLGNLPLHFQKDRWHPVDDVPPELKGRIFEVRAASGPFVKLPRDPGDIRLRTMKFLDRDREVFAGYFFVANGGTVCRAEEVRLLAFDLYTKYAYYMKVQVTSVNGIKSGEELADYGGQLIGELLGDLMLCTPDWVKVMRGEYPPPEPGQAPAQADPAPAR